MRLVRRTNHLRRILLPALALCLVAAETARPGAAQTATARVRVDASRAQGRISPLLYGHFLEFMYEGIKGGLHAELIRNRSFEEPPNAAGLSRYWERYPDERNDDYGLSFAWDASDPYPPARRKTAELKEKEAAEHSLKVEAGDGVIIQANRHSVFVSPIYRVAKLYNERRGAERLLTSVEGRTFDTTREGKSVPVLDAVASRSADGRQIFIKLVNTDRQNSLDTSIEVAGARVAGAGRVETITTHTPARMNSFQTPHAIDVRGRQLGVGAGSFKVLLPKQSVSVITLSVR